MNEIAVDIVHSYAVLTIFNFFRNLTLSKSPCICEQMLQQDIMTPVVYYIQKVHTELLAQFKQYCMY